MSDLEHEMLDCIERETGPDPRHAVIWLHGLGADGNDFVPIVPQLGCGRSRAVRFVFPHAPVRPVTINNGMRMRAWYDILGFEIARDQDLRGIRTSMAQVERLIQRELERKIEPHNLLLAGFSQGGAIALRLGLSREQSLGGVVGLSCYLLQAGEVTDWLSDQGRKTPVFMAHGTHDPIVPLVLGQQAAALLSEQQVAVEWSEWPMQHAVCPPEIEALDRWINARFEA